MKKLAFLLLFMLLLSACGSQETGDESGFAPKNPKTADVQIEAGVVTIRIPESDPYFRLDKVNDNSVEYSRIQFKYDGVNKVFLYKTDLEDWKPVPVGEDSIQLGQVLVTFEGGGAVVTYPSGTWAFP